MKNVFITILLFLFVPNFTVLAQQNAHTDSISNTTSLYTPRVKKPKPITKERSVGLRLNSDGYTVFFETGKSIGQDAKRIENLHDTRLWQFEFSEKNAPKELRMYGWDRDKQSDKKYVFAKTNSFYALKFNYIYRKMIAGKPFAKTVSVHWVNGAGLAIGLLKPYYINAYDGAGALKPMKYTPENAEYFLNTYRITGSSGLIKGIGETKIIPGLHLKTALHFDYSKNKFWVTAIETGATAEIYTSKIELMANQKSQQYFFNVYAGFQFGNRRR